MTDNTNRAIFQAVFGPVGQAWPLLEPVCPSGECTWPLFSSLAVCVSMENVTDQLVFSSGRNQQGDTNYTASLLNGTASLSAPESMPLMQMVSPEPPTEEYSFPLYRESVAFNNRPDLLNTTFSQFFFIYNNNKVESRRQSFRAVELLWHFCVNTYNVTVSGGQARTNIVETRTQVDEVFDAPDPIMRLKAPEGYEGDEEFIIDSWWEYTRLDLDMRRAFSGNWGPNVGTDWPYSEASRQFGLKIYPQGPNITVEDADRRMWNGIGDIAQAMGDSMTNLLRTTGEAVQGTVLMPQTFVRVRWEWLAFLSAQVGLSIVFVGMVVVQTARLDLEIVKSSALAGVFAVSGRGKMALEEDGRDSWGFSVGSASGSAKSKPASRATARLERDGEGDGWTLAVWPGEESGERKRRVRQSVQRMAVSNHQGFT
ncbi:hypothetical protein F5X68DRAFT_217206 [Plectosphaerella plurivora]|uniref:Uncharacterized protein n=1 Tax=Plectosphaerella plurivora TaxID=936078 RepID=A0A9P8V2F7_9PEZI|nr:hypothetical protein F5X68DRAFT_217206 [Plectosphaerella plurivora]